MLIGTDQAYRAVAARDPRFDGYFILAVRTTGIYCRPSCPATTPKPSNAEFFPTAGAAQAAGYRACRRCLPDAVPGSPEWDLRTDLAGRAMRLINDGVVEREGVSGLAARLGYSPRHLTRELRTALGAGPLALARAHRAHAARVLIETTSLAFGDIAFAAGFTSIRQFNDTVRAVFGRAPSGLRARTHPVDSAPAPTPAASETGAITLRLPYRQPWDAGGTIAFLAARAIPGVETVTLPNSPGTNPDDSGEHRGASTTGEYARSLRLPHGAATLRLRPREGHVECRLRLADPRDLGTAVNRVRRLLDLDADPVAVGAVLSKDPALAGAVAASPGVRVPGSVDGHEAVLRALLGQQVSVSTARGALGALAEQLGESLARPDGGVRLLLPTAAEVAAAPESALRGPHQRMVAVRHACELLAGGELHVDQGRGAGDLRRDLLAVRGIGPWTAGCVLQRVLGSPDVLLDGDLAVRRGARALGLPATPGALRRHSDRWSPWRSYAGMYLWRAGAPLH